MPSFRKRLVALPNLIRRSRRTFRVPGGYVEEVLSARPPIVGVATSVTAFVGRAAKGPTDEAIGIRSLSDFESVFGGLWEPSNLGYQVAQFFRNGGSHAIVVRVHRNSSPDGDLATVQLPAGVDSLTLVARSQGQWGQSAPD